MSRQFAFIQSEADAENFIAEVYRRKGALADEKQTILTQDESLAILYQKVLTHFCRFQIIPEVGDNGFSLDAGQRNIEFLASVRGNAQSRIFHDGRLYMSEYIGAVTPELVKFYNGLRSYIRKHYVYCRQYHVYFGPVFLEKHSVEHWFAAEWTTGRLYEVPTDNVRSMGIVLYEGS